MPVSVIVADDDNLFRRGFAKVLGEYPDIRMRDPVINGHDAIMVLRQSPPDVILLDYSMPKMSGLDVLRLMKEENIKTAAIIISSNHQEEIILDCISAGAMSYFSKDEDYDDIYAAVRTVAAGDFYHTSLTKQAMLQMVHGKKRNNLIEGKEITFDERERALITCLCRGMTSEQASKLLNISYQSVNRIRQDLIHRVGAQNSQELVFYASRHGLA